MDSQGNDDLQLNQSKRRRSSTSGEKANKKARLGSGEKFQHSPSVFERLGNNVEGVKNMERRGSNEKSRHSPSVFERLGSQGSSSSTQFPAKSDNSDHSAHMAAQLSNHSASSVAAHCPHSSGTLPGNGSDKIMKEGLMVNSNPSKPQ